MSVETITVRNCDFCGETILADEEFCIKIEGNPFDACGVCKSALLSLVANKNLRELLESRRTLYPAKAFDVGKTVTLKKPERPADVHERSLEPASEPGALAPDILF